MIVNAGEAIFGKRGSPIDSNARMNVKSPNRSQIRLDAGASTSLCSGDQRLPSWSFTKYTMSVIPPRVMAEVIRIV